MNDVCEKLLNVINEENEAFDVLVQADNTLGINVSSEDIKNFLEFATDDFLIKEPIIGNILITEGDIISVLKIIHDIVNYEGVYTLYINDDNVGTITYLVSRANKIYHELNIDVSIKIDYSENYNSYLDSLVTICGSADFVKTASSDFSKANKVIM